MVPKVGKSVSVATKGQSSGPSPLPLVYKAKRLLDNVMASSEATNWQIVEDVERFILAGKDLGLQTSTRGLHDIINIGNCAYTCFL